MKRKPINQQLMVVLGATMGLVYLGGGLLLVTSSLSFSIFPNETFRYLFGALLIAYGTYRIYRAVNEYRRENP
ncbi:MAG: hypothetical protein EAZ70_01700 [Runella slithyformis]|jgi:uncharacterized membrane protein YfcA|nr:MAG: hypothetical protein EAY79_05530 [Runella slithyformis]TAF94803.1 MAG: hypothetical protein EAZ46_09335 [Runella sp.]TAG17615.1 MAG: hypothetical protein EAZ38_17105 [Cytophagales bacterium]TAG36595.1 MAG: hypothetical protein EAZ32_16685 [Cytophagia bacterium]TAE96706.1 MAG: hypothetical protein EAZ80_08195 [Runella slithyformis]